MLAAAIAAIFASYMDLPVGDIGAVILSAIVFSYVLTSGGIK
jgi:hypothetical protein